MYLAGTATHVFTDPTGSASLLRIMPVDPALPGEQQPRPAAQQSALLTDLYELTMMDAYYQLGMEQLAVFEFYVRRLPDQRNFLVAAGLEQVLDYLETVRFTPEEIAWVESSGRFSAGFARWRSFASPAMSSR
jgi:nicotinic acid phosphoribosyltransferase